MINPSDTHDLIAQVLAEQDIDLDNFDMLDGPMAFQHATVITEDPFVASLFFHTIIKLVLETLMDIRVGNRHRKTEQTAGVFGKVSAYVGAVEAQR
jgi:hypothetical protein